MSGINEDRDRQVVPRWRTFQATLSHHELSPLKVREVSQFNNELVEHLRQDWLKSKSPIIASDFVSVAHALGLTEIAKDAAEFLTVSRKAKPLSKFIALRYLGFEKNSVDDFSESMLITRTDLQPKVALLRHQLQKYPKNPIQWANLARYYTTLGLPEKARRAMLVALDLAPNHRFILRAASRMFLHQGDKRYAHKLLDESPLSSTDPWVMASEIAIAAARGTSSKRIKAAMRFLDDEKFLPKHLSELASAVGTLEIKNGNKKKGRRWLEQSQNMPNENSIAQLGWLVRREHIPAELLSQFPTTPSSEANAWISYASQDWEQAILEVKIWHNDQPFSSRPALLGSYLASAVNDDARQTVEFAEVGLLCNPDDIALYNNLSFALIMQGELKRSKNLLAKALSMSPGPDEEVALIATKGLWHYRSGQPAEGRKLYELSCQKAKKNSAKQFAIASLMLAQEESHISSPDALQLRLHALELIANIDDPIIAIMAKRLDKFAV